MYKTIPFLSYKGGAGRTFVTVNVAEALILQGLNVVVVDLDIEAPGVTIFSSIDKPSPIFWPDYLYRVEEKGLSTLTLTEEAQLKGKSDWVHLPGIVTPFSKVLDDLWNDQAARWKFQTQEAVDKCISEIDIYETRTPVQHPLEGRLFMVPVGGGFAKIDSTPGLRPGRSPWLYTPPKDEGDEGDERVKREGKASILGIVQDLMFSAEFQFVQPLVKRIASKLEAIGAAPDFILLDLRPGMEGRSMLSVLNTDGAVIVTSTGRGSLMGTRTIHDMLLNLRRQTDDNTLNAPPIAGCVVSGLPSPNKPTMTGETGIEAFYGHEQQIQLAAHLEREKPSGDVVLADKAIEYYLEMFRCNLGVKNYQVTADLAASYDGQPSAIKSLWSSLGLRADVKNANITGSLLPLAYDVQYRWHDHLALFRDFVLSTGLTFDGAQDDVIHMTRGIIALAGHLRCLGTKDMFITKWDELNCTDTKGLQPISRQLTDEDGWQASWLETWLMLRDGNLQKALASLDNTAALQQLAVNKLPPARRQGWEGDWRIAWLRCLILEKLERWSDFERNVELTFELLGRSKADRAAQIMANHWQWPMKNSSIGSIETKMLQKQGQAAYQQRRFEEAWRAYEQCLSIVGVAGIVELIDEVKCFAQHELCPITLAEQIFDNLGRVYIPAVLKRSNLRQQLQLRNAELLFLWYWVQPDKTRKGALQEVINLVTEWRHELGSKEVDEGHKSLALRLQGEAFLELARIEQNYGQEQNIQMAKECFNEAVVWDIENEEVWLLAAITRFFVWYNFKLNIETKSSQGKYIEMQDHAEVKVLQRDAYYALEQVIALLDDIAKPEWFADADVAGELQGLLGQSIHYILETSRFNLPIKERCQRWLLAYTPSVIEQQSTYVADNLKALVSAAKEVA